MEKITGELFKFGLTNNSSNAIEKALLFIWESHQNVQTLYEIEALPQSGLMNSSIPCLKNYLYLFWQ